MKMKKFLILTLMSFLVKFTTGQNYDRDFKPFKIDASVGYGIPDASDTKGGLLFAFEPKYALLSDQVCFGLRLEGALTKIAANSDSINANVNSESATNISALFTSDFYFNNNEVRPFLGCGTGAYTINTVAGKNEGQLLPDIAETTHWGFMLRGGIEWGHLRAGLEYNFVSSSASQSFKYIGVKVGVLLGGGRFNMISDN